MCSKYVHSLFSSRHSLGDNQNYCIVWISVIYYGPSVIHKVMHGEQIKGLSYLTIGIIRLYPKLLKRVPVIAIKKSNSYQIEI